MMAGRVTEPWTKDVFRAVANELLSHMDDDDDAVPFSSPTVAAIRKLARRRKIMALHRRTHG